MIIIITIIDIYYIDIILPLLTIQYSHYNFFEIMIMTIISMIAINKKGFFRFILIIVIMEIVVVIIIKDN